MPDLRAAILTAPLEPALHDETVGVLTVYAQRRLPGVVVVGAGATAAQELAARVRTAIGSADFPRRRLTVTLPPGGRDNPIAGYDLPTALAVLHLETPTKLAGVAAVGELSLSGDVRPVRGLVGRVRALVHSADTILVPARGADVLVDVLDDAALARVRPVSTLDEARRVIADPEHRGTRLTWSPTPPPRISYDPSDMAVSLLPVLRALAVGAALRIPVLGCDALGIVASSRRLPAMLPPLTRPEQIRVAETYSNAGLLTERGPIERPFRAPHHSVSDAGLRQEMDLARHGVLLLDEVEEFRRLNVEIATRGVESGDYTLVYASRNSERTLRTPRGLRVTAPPLRLEHGVPEGSWWQERIAAVRAAPALAARADGRADAPSVLRGRLLAALAVFDGTALPEHETEVDGWLTGFGEVT